MEPVTNPDLHTPLQSNKKDHFQHDQQQIINRLEEQISALKSHLKCEVSTMNSRIDLLSEVIENKINVLSDQCKNIEVVQDNIKFLQVELKTKNEIIKNLLDTQSAIVESLSLEKKQQNSQAASLAKQQTKIQDEPELHCTKLAQSTRESFQQHQQNKHQKKFHNVDQHIQKQKYQSRQQLKQNCKKLYVGNLNPKVTEEDINELFGLKSTEYLRRNCSVEIVASKCPLIEIPKNQKGFHF